MFCSHGPNPPAILIDCTRTIWIVYDCETLRNCDCSGLPHDFVDCDGISTDYRPTIGSAIQKIASQSTKSGRNRNPGIKGKRADCGVLGGEKLVIFSKNPKNQPTQKFEDGTLIRFYNIENYYRPKCICVFDIVFVFEFVYLSFCICFLFLGLYQDLGPDGGAEYRTICDG